jgi:hypothetical protein
MVYGSPARVRGGNIIGMRIAGIDEALITQIVEALNNSDLTVLRRLIPKEMSDFDAAEASQQH